MVHKSSSSSPKAGTPGGEKENRRDKAIQEIADLAWSAYSDHPSARQIYAICRDRLGVTAGPRSPQDEKAPEITGKAITDVWEAIVAKGTPEPQT